MTWVVFGYVRANPINYDGPGVSKRHTYIEVEDKPTAERLALKLCEEDTSNRFKYVTFFKKEVDCPLCGPDHNPATCGYYES